MKANEGFPVSCVRRNDKGKARHVLGAYPNAHVCVRQVYLGHVYRAQRWVRREHLEKYAMKGTAELHRFRRRCAANGIVEATERKVVNEAGAPTLLRYDAKWAEP